MPKAATITNGVVTNTIEATPGFAASIGAVPCGEDVSIGWTYTAKDGFKPPATPSVDLTELKSRLKLAVDAAAELERQKYITPGAGQAMTYQAKAAEALRYAETEGAGDYPFLTQEVGITGATLAEVAVVVDSMHSQWLAIGGLIEKARLSTKAAIDLAETEDAARSAFSGLNFEEF